MVVQAGQVFCVEFSFYFQRTSIKVCRPMLKSYSVCWIDICYGLHCNEERWHGSSEKLFGRRELTRQGFTTSTGGCFSLLLAGPLTKIAVASLGT